jgi:PAS domain S-box-containing protein
MTSTTAVAPKGDPSLALHAAIFEFSADAIITMDLDGLITGWNPAAEQLYDYASKEILGHPITMLCSPDRRDEMMATLEKIRHGQRVGHYETVRVRKDGQVIPVSLAVTAMRDADGTITGASSSARDITERKEAEGEQTQATQYARSLFEASLDSLVTLSVEGKITDVNEATIKVTGVAREGLIGSDFFDYFTEPDKAREGYQRVFAEGSVTDYPLTICHQNGGLTDVLYNASVYRDAGGNVIAVVAVARDVTEQKQAQADIAEQQAKEMERLAELERFQRLTVGRELKMIELKKEIVELNALIAMPRAASS